MPCLNWVLRGRSRWQVCIFCEYALAVFVIEFVFSILGLYDLTLVFRIVDVGLITKSERVATVSANFKTAWAKERALPKEQVSLWRALREVTGIWGMVFALIMQAISAAAQYGPPMILRSLSLHFAAIQCDHLGFTCGQRLSDGVLWFLIAMLFVCPVVGTMFAARSFSIFVHVGCIIRSAIIPAVYEKSLVLSSRSKHEFSTGRIVNLFSNDLMHLQVFFQAFADPFFAPMQLAVGLALIYQEVGVAMFTGFGVIVGVLPLMLVTFVLYGAWRGQKMKFGDTRIKLTNEILNGIRIIKFYAWERPFSQQIIDLREQELGLLGKMNYMIVVIICLIYIIPVIIPIIIFYTYVKLGHTLTPSIAFTVLSLISLVTQPVNQIPQLLQRWMLAQNSVQRIQEFLLADELTPYVSSEPVADSDVVVSFNHASFSWLTEKDVEDERVRVEKETAAEEAKKKADEEKEAKKSAKGKNVSKPPEDGDKKPYGPVATGDDTEKGLELVTMENGGSSVNDVAAGPSSPNKQGPNRSIHTLMNLNLQIKRGQLIAVIGPVGSGKSSFLSAILGELLLRSTDEWSPPASTEASVQPSLHVVGTVAYHAQTPWILNASVRENIIFGQAYDEERFASAIAASCLGPDIAMLPSGLDTEIGEKGINLSGGQKARVSFARAVYQNTDILLLDDPLSAVDAHVGQHLFHTGIKNALRGKTRILVTHQVHLLDDCDAIVVLDAGCVRGCGTMRQLHEMGIDVNALMAKTSPSKNRDRTSSENRSRTRTGSDHSGTSGTPRARTGSESSDAAGSLPRRGRSRSDGSTEDVLSVNVEGVDAAIETAVKILTADGADGPNAGAVVDDDDELSIDEDEHHEKDAKIAKKDDPLGKDLMTKEERTEGAVEGQVYFWYFKVGGWTPLILMLLVSFAAQLGTSYSSFWLADWGKEANESSFSGTPLSTHRNVYYLNIFAMLSLTSLLGAGLRGGLTVYHGLRASRYMHHTMLARVVSAPIAFFDTTPLGRIVNRFSSDITMIDDGCGFQLGWISGMVMTVFGIIGNIAYTTNGTFLALLVPLCVIYYYVQLYFRRTNVELKRLESISRSPIYTEFSQALAGSVSLRAYRISHHFIKRMQDYVDANSTVWILQNMCSWWLNLRLDIMGGTVSLFCAVLATAAPGFVPDNYLALALQNAFAVTATLKWLVLMGAMYEALMNNVERVHHYCTAVDNEEVYTSKNNALEGPVGVPAERLSERPLNDQEMEKHRLQNLDALIQQVAASKHDPPADWPSEGRISGHDIEMAYRSGPLVLKGCDFEIDACQKVGIAGRTGCGKSSLMIAIFRMERLANGRILIDDVDIETIPLEKLRSKLGIIPQDPVLFSSSIRFNLDPFSLHSDAEIWAALNNVNMKEAIEALPSKLQEVVAEGGENFSAGERQLLCIARALLRKPKVLVLDEATASVDNETDTLIQTTIRTQFKDCTILTIAHRLHTIIDSDRVMVVEQGKIAEMDTPERLVQKEDGLFAALWKQHQLSRDEKKGSNRKGARKATK
jgi:ATP-binding cassette subfamily C (CFTR/MRP) protein 1